MKNKKGFAIMPLEIVRLLIYLFFGMGAWFVYSSAKDVIIDYGFTSIQSLLLGVGILAGVLFLVKFKPHMWILG